jgi:hypothetical protein
VEFEREIKVRVWVWDGPTPWYFVTIPEKESAEINHKFGSHHRGWGSIPVLVRIGTSTWKTSIFWEKKGTYMLPIKKQIRAAEKISSGDMITLHLIIENVI